jgi:hypothetical protein
MRTNATSALYGSRAVSSPDIVVRSCVAEDPKELPAVARGVLWSVGGEVVAQGENASATRMAGGCRADGQGSTRVMVSATQTGRSTPWHSTTQRTATWVPAGTPRTPTIVGVARILDPTGTGAGNLTLSTP